MSSTTNGAIPVPMEFGLALAHMRGGDRVQRRFWNSSCYLELQGCVIVVRGDGRDYPWVSCQNDILADDWRIVHSTATGS